MNKEIMSDNFKTMPCDIRAHMMSQAREKDSLCQQIFIHHKISTHPHNPSLSLSLSLSLYYIYQHHQPTTSFPHNSSESHPSTQHYKQNTTIPHTNQFSTPPQTTPPKNVRTNRARNPLPALRQQIRVAGQRARAAVPRLHRVVRLRRHHPAALGQHRRESLLWLPGNRDGERRREFCAVTYLNQLQQVVCLGD
jgi:hypothetical protein